MNENKAQAPATTLPKYIPWVYMAYSFLNGFSSLMALSHLQFYVTEYTGITITSFVAVVTVARFADLGVSLISGAIIQRQARVRPLLVLLYGLSQIGTIMCFLNPPISTSAKLVVIIVFYCCIHFPMNFLTVVASTLLIKIAGPNPNNRLAIASMQQRGTSLMRIATAAVVPTIVFFNTFLPDGRGYFVVTCILAVFTCAANLMLYIVSKPFEPLDSPKPSVSGAQTNIFKMYASAAKNVPILIMLLCSMMTGIGTQVMSAGLQYYWKYSSGNFTLQSLQTLVAGFVAFGFAVICPPIARKLGNKKSAMFMYAWCALCYTVNFFFADGNPYVYMTVTCLMSLGTTISMSWGQNLWIDAAEIQLHETGVDNRPFLMSMSNLPIKLGFIISGPFVAYMLNHSGYSVVDGIGQMADTAQFVKVWLIIPLMAYILAGIVFTFGYRVDPDYAREAAISNKKVAEERIAAAAAAAGGPAPTR